MNDGEKPYEIHFAPLQGYTDWIYRNTFAAHFCGADAYYTPFVRVEKGDVFRKRDLRDIDPANNTVSNLIPQILPGSVEEFRLLVQLVREKGYSRVDINLGCPFPLIAGKRKGAGMLPYPEEVEQLLAVVDEFPEVVFSLKMRLGWGDADECIRLLPIINAIRLCSVTIHARIGKQQYKGETNLDAFERFYRECKHPLFYNGDLSTSEDIENILKRFPLLRGVMIGRGLLASPFLIADFRKSAVFLPEERMERARAFHKALFVAYSGHLQDELQLLMKMKTFWDYFLPETDRKMLKKIKKANKLSQYNEVVNNVQLWGCEG